MDQTCIVFRNIAYLELNFNPPRYKNSNIIYIIKNKLKEKLDQLNEQSVINVIDAYNYLPKLLIYLIILGNFLII